jgi:hypothetical protein
VNALRTLPRQVPKDLASRIFGNKAFELLWVVFLLTFVTLVSFPVQRILLVWIVYGWHAYAEHRVYVVPRKPLRFSDGTLVPQHLDAITGLGTFAVTVVGLTLALHVGLCLYQQWFGDRQETPDGEDPTSCPQA